MKVKSLRLPCIRRAFYMFRRCAMTANNVITLSAGRSIEDAESVVSVTRTQVYLVIAIE